MADRDRGRADAPHARRRVGPARGDVACFPAGAAGAHAVRNHTDAPVRYAMPSTNARHGGASVYPDSGKVRVSGPGFDHRGRLGEPVEYWEGET